MSANIIQIILNSVRRLWSIAYTPDSHVLLCDFLLESLFGNPDCFERCSIEACRLDSGYLDKLDNAGKS